MSFKIESFATLRLSSTDVAKSRDWYKALFGFPPLEDLENFVSFKIQGTVLDIALADDKSPLSSGGSVGYWLVDDLNLLLSKVQELGGRVYRGPLRVDEVQRTIVQIQDPLGCVMGFEARY